MKNIFLTTVCLLILFSGFSKNDNLIDYPIYPKADNEKSPLASFVKDKTSDEGYYSDKPWKLNGFELFIGGGIYMGSKKTANYYNGAPENNINLGLIFNNKYYREEIFQVLRREYPYIDTMKLEHDYNQKSGYNITMDIALGARYRFQNNWYIELSYSFRRLTSQNRFYFTFPGVPPGNKENPNYSRWESLVAKEDRHYIDFSVGYILHLHAIAKPFISIGALFTYIDIKSFDVFIEGHKFNLMAMAKNPNYIPGIQTMPNYRVWSGVGYGFTVTAGLKIAVHPTVSLDPVFQLSVASFGNNKNLPSFYTNLCFNYMAGVRIVLNDALFFKNK
ncbi:MAG: hypothetical protein LBU83_09315 [Bacteroidales bacterium]|jgi:opacity protein-like surface antigen|nr:hypothetical protein [Bacteroidales bacterium]